MAITFDNQGVVVDVGTEGQWDDERASFPGVWKDGDNWYMVYEGYSGGSCPSSYWAGKHLQMAINWTKEPGNPILEQSGSGFMGHENWGHPHCIRKVVHGNLFYHGFDLVDCQIGVATRVRIY